MRYPSIVQIAKEEGRALLTAQDLDDVPDDANRYEVIDGALHVSPFPGYAHQFTLKELLAILDGHVRRNGLGEVFPSGLKVVLAEPTGVGPDIVYVSTARMDQMREDGFYGAPDLVIEVSSTRPNLDRVVKRAAYERAGIAHYWIADPAKRSFEALRLDGDHYRTEARVEGEGEFRPSLFPGLGIDVASLWPR